MTNSIDELISMESVTLVDICRRRAIDAPNERAFVFLLDGDQQEISLTYAQLDRQAQAIAASIQGFRGKRALLIYPDGLEFVAAFFGCLYAGVIAVPAFPPHPLKPERALPRLRSIAQNCAPAVALTTAATLADNAALLSQLQETKKVQCLATDQTLDGAFGPTESVVELQDIAFLQYTSGSTAQPKGVAVKHENLMHNQRLINHAFGNDDDTLGVGWLPLYHDMGLIGNVLQAIYVGKMCVLMPPLLFLQRPIRWLNAISRFRATTSGGPNFAYDLCARKITDEQKRSLDLSCWKVAFNGAEPLRPETIRLFTDAFASCGFRPEAMYTCYGLAESTLIVTGGTISDPPVTQHVDAESLLAHRVVASVATPTTREIVSSGRPILDLQVAIVDPHTKRRCDADEVGEIWIKGGSVASGYWERPDDTEEMFRAYIADSDDGPYLRSGDLGYVDQGELFVTGRLKEVIIIGGRNHYPQDIEASVEACHPAIGGCAAFSTMDNQHERLVVVVELDYRLARRRGQTQAKEAGGDNSNKEVEMAVRNAVASNHDLQTYRVVLVALGTVPKTSSGKRQRNLCRDRYLADELELINA